MLCCFCCFFFAVIDIYVAFLFWLAVAIIGGKALEALELHQVITKSFHTPHTAALFLLFFYSFIVSIISNFSDL